MEHDVVHLVPARRPSAWRRTIGALLRAAREERGLRLVDVAARARLSPQYLSEVERGRKEASSEVLAAITDALGLTLVDLARGIVDVLDVAAPVRSLSSWQAGPSPSSASTLSSPSRPSSRPPTPGAPRGRGITLLAA